MLRYCDQASCAPELGIGISASLKSRYNDTRHSLVE